jgi:hypothetical protein
VARHHCRRQPFAMHGNKPAQRYVSMVPSYTAISPRPLGIHLRQPRTVTRLATVCSRHHVVHLADFIRWVKPVGQANLHCHPAPTAHPTLQDKLSDFGLTTSLVHIAFNRAGPSDLEMLASWQVL